MSQEIPGQSRHEELLRAGRPRGQGLRLLRSRESPAGQEVQGEQEGLEGESYLEISPPVISGVFDFRISNC